MLCVLFLLAFRMSREKLSLLDVIKSTLMSFLGVQKDSVRERDFASGRPFDFIIVGVLLTILFIVVLVGIVKLVLYFAGV